MALSNATQQAPGKAHVHAGKHGAKHAAQLTGLEFLTGGEAVFAGDGTAAQQGAGFASLVQSMAAAIFPAQREAATTASKPSEGGTDVPADAAPAENPEMLLALALQGGKESEAASPKGEEQPVAVPAQTPAAAAHHALKHLGKRVQEAAKAPVMPGEIAEETAEQPDSVIVPEPKTETVVAVATPPASTQPSAQPQAASAQTVVDQPHAVSAQPVTAPAIAPQEHAARETGKGRDDRRTAVSEATDRTPQPADPAAEKGALVPAESSAKELVTSQKVKDNIPVSFAQLVERKLGVKADKGDRADAASVRAGATAQAATDSAPVVKSTETGQHNSGDRRGTDEGGDAANRKVEGASAPRAEAPSFRAETPAAEARPAASVTGAAPAAQPSVMGALASQVVDMGISGQWIDDIARQIASIGANPGHGSFRIESQSMGAVRVDIAPSERGAGSDVLMRVDNEAAFAALDKDRERLMQDARMASVRIGELRIDRVAGAQDAQGSGSSTSQQQGNSQGGQQQGLAQNNTQTGGQMDNRGGQQPGRQDAAAMGGQRDGQQSPKAPFTTAVINGAERDDAARNARSGRGDTARYA